MSFHRRHLSDENIIALATNNDFQSFQKSMTSANDYMFQGNFSHCFWEFFNEEEQAREPLWMMLRSSDDNKNDTIKIVCKSWEIVINPDNNVDHKESLNKYLDLVESSPNKDENLLKIIDIIRKRIKDI